MGLRANPRDRITPGRGTSLRYRAHLKHIARTRNQSRNDRRRPGQANVLACPRWGCSIEYGIFLRPVPSTAHESRQSRNKRDIVVAFGADLPSRRSGMLLRMLRRELRAALHHAALSWLSTSRTGRAIRKRRCCIRSSPSSWRRSSPVRRNESGRFRRLWNASSGTT